MLVRAWMVPLSLVSDPSLVDKVCRRRMRRAGTNGGAPVRRGSRARWERLCLMFDTRETSVMPKCNCDCVSLRHVKKCV